MDTFVPTNPLYVIDSVTISSLGMDSATTAAAMRAGIDRPVPLPGFPVLTEDGEEMDVTGYPVELLTAGFEGAGRYRVLLNKLFSQIELKINDPEFEATGNLYLLVGVPDQNRYLEGKDFQEGEPVKVEDVEFDLCGESWESIVEKSLISQSLFDKFKATRIIKVRCSDSALLLKYAHQALSHDSEGTVLVATLDTLTDFAGLTWLYATGRLKTPNYPAGVTPGECAICLFVSRKKRLRSLHINSVYIAEEKSTIFDDVPADGSTVASLLSRHFAQTDCAWTIANLTGEQKMAHEWGMCIVKLPNHIRDKLLDNAWLPALTVGDLGICYVSLALVWIQQAAERGYGLGDRCAVLVFDHNQNRALVSVGVEQ